MHCCVVVFACVAQEGKWKALEGANVGFRFIWSKGMRIILIALLLVDMSRNLEVVGGEETQIARMFVR